MKVIDSTQPLHRVSFSQYMDWCLYGGGGYYLQNPENIFGQHGDFITAYSSKGFCTLLARFISDFLDKADMYRILEIGAGTGILAEAIIEYRISSKKAIEYYIIDVSPAAHQAQQQRLLRFNHKVVWISSCPEQFDGLIFANEWLDAIAVDIYRMQHDIWHKIYVDTDMSTYAQETCVPFDGDPILPLLNNLIQTYPYLANNVPIEIRNYHHIVNKYLASSQAVLLMDYGSDASSFYQCALQGGTLACYTQHNVHKNPYILLQQQDISVSVNFTDLASSLINIYPSIIYGSLESFMYMLFQKYDGQNLPEDVRLSLRQIISPLHMGSDFRILFAGSSSYSLFDSMEQENFRL